MSAAAPVRPPEYAFGWGPSRSLQLSPPPPPPPQSPVSSHIDLSPALIAMMAVLSMALVIVVYVRLLSRPLRRLHRRWIRWRRRRRLALSATDLDFDSSPPPGAVNYGDYYYYSSGGSSNYFLSPYGLDDSAIKTLPVSLYSSSKGKNLYRDCAVCLLEFEDDDTLRTLPLCSHVFHMDCIDVWLRSQANCPLCRAVVFFQETPNAYSNSNASSSPFVPMRAARIRPSFDDLIFNTPQLVPTIAEMPEPGDDEIELESPARTSRDEDRFAGRDFLLERSYSFGFERNLVADQTMMMMMMDVSTASPWTYRNRGFWSKRWASPFVGGSSSSRTSRVFSFRSSRGVNVRSPFTRKRGMFFPLSESRATNASGIGPSSRRTRSLTSPVAFFSRPWGAALSAVPVTGFGSSRLRCGDPEALLSPERLNRR